MKTSGVGYPERDPDNAKHMSKNRIARLSGEPADPLHLTPLVLNANNWFELLVRDLMLEHHPVSAMETVLYNLSAEHNRSVR